MDYKNGKIYRIVSNTSGKQYIGSTTQPLSKRLSYHKYAYHRWIFGKGNFVSSFELIREGLRQKGDYDVDIVLIEDYPCESREQLHKRERHYIETTACVNMNIPTRTSKEYSQYYYQNKDKIKECRKQRREEKIRKLEYLLRLLQSTPSDLSDREKEILDYLIS